MLQWLISRRYGNSFFGFDRLRDVAGGFVIEKAPLPDFKIDQCPQAFSVVFAGLMAGSTP